MITHALLSFRSAQAVNVQLSGDRIRSGLPGLAKPTDEHYAILDKGNASLALPYGLKSAFVLVPVTLNGDVVASMPL